MNRAQMRARLDETLKDGRTARRPGAYLLAGVDDVGAINADFGFDIADEESSSARAASKRRSAPMISSVASPARSSALSLSTPIRIACAQSA